MVKDERITNEQLKTRFYEFPDMNKIIKARQLKWIGKISTMEYTKVPRQFLASWIQVPRKAGRPQLNIRNTYKKALEKIFPKMKKNAILDDWLPETARPDWNSRVTKWLHTRDEDTENETDDEDEDDPYEDEETP